MNRLALGVLIVVLSLAACTPNLSPVSAPNAQSTAVSLAGTMAAQTVAALPTLTLPPPADTATAPILPTNPPTSTSTTAPTNTAVTTSPTAGTPVTGTPATATNTATGTVGPTNTATVTVTGTLPTATKTNTPGPVTATATDLMVPRFYGTQPPMIEYGRVRLINQAKAQVYISFQCDTPEDYYVVVEYPVSGTITVSVPAGRCAWVAWVGGREFAGEVGIGIFEELTFTFKKQSVTIR